MTGLKAVFFWVFGAVAGALLASAWWGAATFGHVYEGTHAPLDLTVLWLIPSVLTVVFIIAACVAVGSNWDS